MEFTNINDQTQGLGAGFRNKFSALNRSILSIIGLIVLLLGIPLAVWLLQRTQVFAPRAVEAPIKLVTGGKSCVVSTDPNKVSCVTFPIKLTSPLGPSASCRPRPACLDANPPCYIAETPDMCPRPSTSACNSDADCSAGNKCFKDQNYPGTCRPADTVCAGVITRACTQPECPANGPCPQVIVCEDFSTPCHVPPGWWIDRPERAN